MKCPLGVTVNKLLKLTRISHQESMIGVKIAAGRGREEIEYKEGMRVGDVLRALRYHPASIALIRLNGLPADLDAELKDGDELLLVPTVGGGWGIFR